MPIVKRFGNWGMAKMVSYIVGQKFDDVSCGFRAYTRETLAKLRAHLAHDAVVVGVLVHRARPPSRMHEADDGSRARIVTVAPSFAERYISSALFEGI